ncbi:MAG: DUF1579 family protein [bacterium]|nr:DUF1579 family protein [bacterium]
MKNILAPLLVLPLLMLLHAAPSRAADAAAQEKSDATFQQFVERGAAAEEQHQKLISTLSGGWHYRATVWAAGSATPASTIGRSENNMILDGRFLESKTTGVLNVGGHDVPANGQGILGYDRAQGLYVSTWINSLSTQVVNGSGKYDGQKRLLTLSGDLTNPLTGARGTYREEIDFVNDEGYRRTIYAVAKGGKPVKLMEIEYSRSPFPTPGAENASPVPEAGGEKP